MLQLSYKRIKEVILKRGMEFFEGNNYDLNLVGIRTKDNTADTFNDFICVLYKINGTECINVFPATTDPGVYYRENPINVLGTGILCEGQHKGLFKRGLHKGKPALVQVSPCRAYRDRDKDKVLEFDPKTIQKGMYGCDMHRANEGRKTTIVGKWSAMCQVPADSVDEDKILNLYDKQVSNGNGDTLTYTLLLEEWFA